MPDTSTPNYQMIKPEIRGSPDTWGNKLNADLDVVDTNLKRVDDRAFGAVLKSGDEEITGYLTYVSTLADPVDDYDIPHKKYVDTAIKNALLSLFPIGTVIMWTGDIGAIPLGWGLCNGQLQEGFIKPDMRDRFVVGAGTTYTNKQIGGSNVHDHTKATGSTILTIGQMPYHNHSAAAAGTHSHNAPWNKVSSGYGAYPTAYGGAGYAGEIGRYVANGLNVDPSSAGSITVNHNGNNEGHTHTISEANNIPLFYAVAFIVRVK
jgi:hypothetical protein